MNLSQIPKYIRVLLIFTILNLIILAIRNNVVGDSTFNFLKSNLWSGVVPFLIVVGMQILDKKLNKWIFIAASLMWLLFYPNAPYMISDLIHPHEEAKDAQLSTLIVYDTLIIFGIAMLSVFYGFVSLKIIFNLYRTRFGDKIAHGFVLFSLALSCLGFYMGRELVSEIKMGNGFLYSSEMFLEPVYIIKTVWNAIWPIGDNLPAWYMMFLFGFVQYQLLIMMKDVGDVEDAHVISKK